MTRAEFAVVMGYLEAGCGKPLSGQAAEVYFDCLGDLPLPILQLAAKRVLLEHRWASFPSVAELREAAALTQRGEVRELSPGEAWDLAWKAIGRIDPEIDGSARRVLESLPPLVADAIRAFGLPSLVYGKEPVGVLRGQFMKLFESIAAREKRAALLPAATKKAIAAAPTQTLPARVAGLLAGVGFAISDQSEAGDS